MDRWDEELRRNAHRTAVGELRERGRGKYESLGKGAVPKEIFLRYFGSGDEPVVPLLHDLDFVALHRDFEHCDLVVLGEMGEDGTADQVREPFAAPEEVLLGLDDGKLVAAALSLDGQHELPTGTVHGDVDLVHLDLDDALDGGAQVILNRL